MRLTGVFMRAGACAVLAWAEFPDYALHGAEWDGACHKTGADARQSPIRLDAIPGIPVCKIGLTLKVSAAPMKMTSEYEPQEIKFKPADGEAPMVLEYDPTTCASALYGESRAEDDAAPATVQKYVLSNVHFHARSEHFINGEQGDAEVHFVFVDDDDHPVAVLGWVLEDSADDASALLNYMSLTTAAEDVVTIPWTETELVDIVQYATYTGSVTSPPCDEPIKWHVSRSHMSKKQSEWLSILKSGGGHGNFRETQNTNDRPISSVRLGIKVSTASAAGRLRRATSAMLIALAFASIV